mmetsp:Transcript_6632/g.18868  ORF Transcript_6632/g.18868 Transcript_6632/m.18868 type:complete len:343 (-) Transcript_6632:257-1285(-)
MREDFAVVSSELRRLRQEDGGREHPEIEREDYLWARCMVLSRAFVNPSNAMDRRSDPMESIFLVPFADLVNHSSSQPNATFDFDDHRQGFVLESTTHIREGQEVLLRYGRKSAAQLLLRYGFAPQAPLLMSEDYPEMHALDVNLYAGLGEPQSSAWAATRASALPVTDHCLCRHADHHWRDARLLVGMGPATRAPFERAVAFLRARRAGARTGAFDIDACEHPRSIEDDASILWEFQGIVRREREAYAPHRRHGTTAAEVSAQHRGLQQARLRELTAAPSAGVTAFWHLPYAHVAFVEAEGLHLLELLISYALLLIGGAYNPHPDLTLAPIPHPRPLPSPTS